MKDKRTQNNDRKSCFSAEILEILKVKEKSNGFEKNYKVQYAFESVFCRKLFPPFFLNPNGSLRFVGECL